ncbi:hypothetical protein D9758_005617 [Tetrapyrgos nigripes]|uniref:Major facilitator superfamily (MFS) profile domain-containing protein n=1 Tax=Tetrapyrgos nigripes TaxID=182062 RepID=A0A8H5LPF8_9AGAR|nr:hypothetical protein D9758_005617 [Tetrapyrgos nigripes]
MPDIEKTGQKRSNHSSTIAEDSPNSSNSSGSESDKKYQVTLDESEHPQNCSTWRKWAAVFVISSCALCVACTSSAASFTENGVAKEFNVSHEVTILAISLFVQGMGLGPLLAGPLSEVYGRNLVYQVSFVLVFALSFAVAFAPNIEIYLIFRFICGFFGSTFLSVAGGSVSDLFDDEHVGNPMAIYTISPFIGPVLGPLLSGFINQNVDWRWTYYVLIMWTFVQTIALFLIVPETFIPVLTARKAARLRRETKNDVWWASLDRQNNNLGQAILISCYRPFQLMIRDPMASLLNLWTSLVLGILYLAFQAFPVVFELGHGFSTQQTGMSFLGIGLGMLLALATQGYWNGVMKRETEKAEKEGLRGGAPPEARLYMGEVGGILIPLGLLLIAVLTPPSIPWPLPIILGSVLFGAGVYFCFTSTFTYLVTAYRPIAASAMASNSAMRSTFAAVFPLFAGFLYGGTSDGGISEGLKAKNSGWGRIGNGLGTVGATGLLAAVMALAAPLPFIFRRIGARLRARSKFAV